MKIVRALIAALGLTIAFAIFVPAGVHAANAVALTGPSPVVVAAGRVDSVDGSTGVATIAGQAVSAFGSAQLGTHVVVRGSLDARGKLAGDVIELGAYVPG